MTLGQQPVTEELFRTEEEIKLIYRWVTYMYAISRVTLNSDYLNNSIGNTYNMQVTLGEKPAKYQHFEKHTSESRPKGFLLMTSFKWALSKASQRSASLCSLKGSRLNLTEPSDQRKVMLVNKKRENSFKGTQIGNCSNSFSYSSLNHKKFLRALLVIALWEPQSGKVQGQLDEHQEHRVAVSELWSDSPCHKGSKNE